MHCSRICTECQNASAVATGDADARSHKWLCSCSPARSSNSITAGCDVPVHQSSRFEVRSHAGRAAAERIVCLRCCLASRISHAAAAAAAHSPAAAVAPDVQLSASSIRAFSTYSLGVHSFIIRIIALSQLLIYSVISSICMHSLSIIIHIKSHHNLFIAYFLYPFSQ